MIPMPDRDTIEAQLQLLKTSRRVLASLLEQKARAGNMFIPPQILLGIEDARADIARCKAWLREQGEIVEDEPNDIDPGAAAVQQKYIASLRARFADHTSFINNRLESFVGRAADLDAIRQRIAALLPTGGYVTITGQAGQGKSSIIAALLAQHAQAGSLAAFLAADANYPIAAVTKAAVEPIAHHFIPFNPGPDHQVSLLRNVLARLALHYALPELYVASDSRPTLKDYFAIALADIAAQGAQAVIYLDGLDQIEEDLNGTRDLSFLPTNPPPGIVFVLGTRPNDTLKPLTLLKPHNEYPLTALSRPDFDAILQHRQVHIAPALADRFYQVMDGNALFLDLAAREIGAAGALPPEQIIARLADDPANLFSFAIDRLKRPRESWYAVIKPTLGLLLAARESLSPMALRMLLRSDADAVRDGLQRLGGLVARDEHGRAYLFHLKLRTFLGERSSQDETQPKQAGFFAEDEIAGHHQTLANWCASAGGGITTIWNARGADAVEDERRTYARTHYITHLAAASDWDQLWAVIDDGAYGHAKLRHDPSTRIYVEDLDRARRAVLRAAEQCAEPLVITLPRLWRYSVLRGHLASQVNKYPIALFTALTRVGRAQEAISLAELLSDPQQKAKTLCQIGYTLKLIGANDGDLVLTRAVAVAAAVENLWTRAKAQYAITAVQAGAGDWASALNTAHAIEDSDTRAEALTAIAVAQAKAGHITEAVALCSEAAAIAHTIEPMPARAEALRAVAAAQAQAGACDAALDTTQAIEPLHTHAEALTAIAVAQAKAGHITEAMALCSEARTIAHKIERTDARSETLSAVAAALAQAGAWQEALALTRTIVKGDTRARAQRAVATVQAQAGAWNIALATARAIEIPAQRARTLSVIATAQAQAGQSAEAIECWHEAAVAARTIAKSESRAPALSEVATAQAKAGAWDEALTTARTVELPAQRARALSAVAAAQAKAGHIATAMTLCDEAAASARAIAQDTVRAEALRAIAAAQAEAKAWEAAHATAHTIISDYPRAQALSALVTAQAQAGMWQEALATAHTITDISTHAQALSTLAVIQAQAGIWPDALAIARTIAKSETRAEALRAIAAAQARAGMWKDALATARSIVNSANVDTRAEAFRAIAIAQAEAGRWPDALATARAITNGDTRAETIRAIAVAQARASMWKDALATARTIADITSRAQALRAIAAAQGRAGIWPDALATARLIANQDIRAEALRAIATAQAEAGVWPDALATTDAITPLAPRIAALSTVVIAQTNAGHIAAAATLWEQITVAASEIEDIDTQIRVFSTIAAAHTELERTAEALTFWDKAAVSARAIEDSGSRAKALRTVATAQAKAGAWKHALATARAIEAPTQRASALRIIAENLLRYTEVEYLDHLVQHAWREATTYEEIWALLPLATHFIIADSTLLPALLDGAEWVNAFLNFSA